MRPSTFDPPMPVYPARLRPAKNRNKPSHRGICFSPSFPSIMLPMFLAVADQTIVATALPAIASDLGDIERASWVVVSYLIANTIAAPVYGRLGDTFGRRAMMIVALGDLHGRVGAVRALAQYRVADGVPRDPGFRRRRPDDAVAGADRRSHTAARARPLSGLSRRRSRSASSTFGPVAGGYLTQAFGWQSIFLINMPLGLIAMLLVLRLAVAPGRPPPHHLRYSGAGAVHLVRRAGDSGARTGAAHAS